MKWWYWLILELLIIFGVIAWIYFFPSELECDFAKGMIGFVLIYTIEDCKDIKRWRTMNYTESVDTVIESIAEAYINAKIWVEKNKRSAVHIVKTHYKDLQDGKGKDCWNIKWDNDRDRIDYISELIKAV